jgi:hypothetical protein
MAYEVYEQDDAILPLLELPNSIEVRIEITAEAVKLLVGPRDWHWSRTTGELLGSGTVINQEGDTPK